MWCEVVCIFNLINHLIFSYSMMTPRCGNDNELKFERILDAHYAKKLLSVDQVIQ